MVESKLEILGQRILKIDLPHFLCLKTRIKHKRAELTPTWPWETPGHSSGHPTRMGSM